MPDPASLSLGQLVEAALERLQSRPFPNQPGLPLPYVAWEFPQAFLADSPRRLVEVIDVTYHDPQQEGAPAISPEALQLQHEALFEAVIQAATQRLGTAPQRDPDPRQFDEDVFGFDHQAIACWPQDQTLLLAHHAVQFGDGDLQVSVCLCKVPRP